MKENIKELLYELKLIAKMASNLEDELQGNERDVVGGVKLSLYDLVEELEKLN